MSLRNEVSFTPSANPWQPMMRWRRWLERVTGRRQLRRREAVLRDLRDHELKDIGYRRDTLFAKGRAGPAATGRDAIADTMLWRARRDDA